MHVCFVLQTLRSSRPSLQPTFAPALTCVCLYSLWVEEALDLASVSELPVFEDENDGAVGSDLIDGTVAIDALDLVPDVEE